MPDLDPEQKHTEPSEHDRWQALEVRRPEDVRTSTGGPVPLGWQAEKYRQHAERLSNRDLPADFPYEVERGTVDDVLAVLALREAMRRDIESGRGSRVHDAALMGATWTQIADALELSPDEARTVLREYADGQHRLWNSYKRKPFGMDYEEYAAAVALCELGDDEQEGDRG